MSESISSMSSTTGFGSAIAPAGQRSPVSARPGPDLARTSGQHPVQKLVAQRNSARSPSSPRMVVHGASHVFARGLGGLDVRIHATEVARVPAVQQVPQREQGGGLAGLARCMQHEVTLVADASEHVVEVQPAQRRDAVVLVRAHRPFGVELAHGGSMTGPPSPNTAPGAAKLPVPDTPNGRRSSHCGLAAQDQFVVSPDRSGSPGSRASRPRTAVRHPHELSGPSLAHRRLQRPEQRRIRRGVVKRLPGGVEQPHHTLGQEEPHRSVNPVHARAEQAHGRHIPHTVIVRPRKASSQRKSLSSHRFASLRSKMTRCPASHSQRSM